MKYMLDIVLVVGLLWLGHLWNGQKQNGVAQGDEIARLKSTVARLEADLGAAKAAGEKTSTDLVASQEQLAQTTLQLQETADELSAKTTEAEGLMEAARRLKARVAELEGYKAQAIVAEMPKPIQP